MLPAWPLCMLALHQHSMPLLSAGIPMVLQPAMLQRSRRRPAAVTLSQLKPQEMPRCRPQHSETLLSQIFSSKRCSRRLTY